MIEQSQEAKLEFAKAILIKESCSTCWHNRNSTSLDPYHCAIYSYNCATAITNHLRPPRWMSYEDGEVAELRLLRRSL